MRPRPRWRLRSLFFAMTLVALAFLLMSYMRCWRITIINEFRSSIEICTVRTKKSVLSTRFLQPGQSRTFLFPSPNDEDTILIYAQLTGDVSIHEELYMCNSPIGFAVTVRLNESSPKLPSDAFFDEVLSNFEAEKANGSE